MKKNVFKFLSILLCFMLISVAFSGCEKANNEAEPQKEQVAVLNTIRTSWLGDVENYIVGEDMSINEFGQIIELIKLYDDVGIEYNADHTLSKVKVTDKDDGTIGYELWNYENGMAISGEADPNDGFHSSKKYDISTKEDADGRITELTESIEYKTAKEGKISHSIIRYEFEYDTSEKITSVKYYIDEKLDHVTKLSYDNDGNLIKYSNVDPKNSNLYLELEFTYKKVDADSVTILEQNSFEVFFTWTRLINHIV